MILWYTILRYELIQNVTLFQYISYVCYEDIMEQDC